MGCLIVVLICHLCVDFVVVLGRLLVVLSLVVVCGCFVCCRFLGVY